ncbi:MAG TPA: DUF5343 domain-containing protein [Methyloceanibacter sp.]|nr:DUF5343 domain-containing protein [Methyloceanibacter sp.]
MARKVDKTGKSKTSDNERSEPKFPYTTKPSSLRRLLKDIPNKPKPPKFTRDLLRSWGFNDNNDATMLRVLKAINLLDGQSVPTPTYTQYMNLTEGAKALGPEIKRVYEPLFQASHTPYLESNERLQNLFNIHSGGAASSLDFQIQTFKALCENASFDDAASTGTATDASTTSVARGAAGGIGSPIVHIDLHIHLPENKTRREYEDIIEDIGKYIFGRDIGERRE